MLPYPLVCALPLKYNALADALLWILKQHGVSTLQHYLDDFITLGQADSTHCDKNCQIMFGICELLGVPLAKEKCQSPSTCIDYLGFRLDTMSMTVHLPEEKITRLSALLQSWIGRKACTKHELESLIGQLQHASAVLRPGRSFLRRMIILSKSKRKPSHPLRLNMGFRSDLAWWILFLQSWNGLSLMSAVGREKPAFTVTSDASGSWGCGAYFSTHWFQLQWSPAAATKSIAFLELLPIIIAGLIWGRQWTGKTVQCQCDNQVVVSITR